MRHRRRAAVAQVVRTVLRTMRPVPVAGPQPGVLVRRPRLRAGPHEPETGRHHQTLLRRGDGDVDTPLVHEVPVAAERGDAVDHQQRRVIGGVDRPADGGDVVAHRRAGVDVHREDRLDRPVGVGPQARLDVGRVDRRPVGRVDGLDLDAGHRGHLAPDDREPAGFEHEHTVAARQRVADRHLPRAMTVRHGHERRRRRAGDAGELLEDLVGDVEQLTRVDVGHRPVHGRQHPVGDHRRPGDRHHVTTVVERSLHVSILPPARSLPHRFPNAPWSRCSAWHAEDGDQSDGEGISTQAAEGVAG